MIAEGRTAAPTLQIILIRFPRIEYKVEVA